jgi:hypothetical protein
MAKPRPSRDVLQTKARLAKTGDVITGSLLD